MAGWNASPAVARGPRPGRWCRRGAADGYELWWRSGPDGWFLPPIRRLRGCHLPGSPRPRWANPVPGRRGIPGTDRRCGCRPPPRAPADHRRYRLRQRKPAVGGRHFRRARPLQVPSSIPSPGSIVAHLGPFGTPVAEINIRVRDVGISLRPALVHTRQPRGGHRRQHTPQPQQTPPAHFPRRQLFVLDSRRGEIAGRCLTARRP